MAEGGAAQAYVDKLWRQRPECRLLHGFARGEDIQRLPLWGALLREIDEAMFGLADPMLARTKLSWWGSDLAAVQSQHPLARVLRTLAPAALPWQALTEAAAELAAQSASTDPLPKSAWLSFARPLAAIESALFESAVEVEALAAQLQCRDQLARWLAASSASTTSLTAQQHSERCESARQCRRQLPAAFGPNLWRAGEHRFLQARLRLLARGASVERVRRLPPWQVLWLAWRAARDAMHFQARKSSSATDFTDEHR